MRGCGRGCKFCDVTLRPLRYYPVEKVIKEIEINMKYGGLNNAWVHSDDIFVYGLNPRTTKNMQPNREALEELFTGIMSTGIAHTNPTHGTLAGAIASWIIRSQKRFSHHAALAFFDFFTAPLRAFSRTAGVEAKLRFNASIRSITGALLGWAVTDTRLPFCFSSIRRSIFSR